MGKMIEKIAIERKHSIKLVIDEPEDWDHKADMLNEVDTAIEFTQPDQAHNNIKRLFDHKIPVVTGTTGWDNDLKNLKEYCIANDLTLFHAPNFNIGMNIFMKTNKLLAALINQHAQYNIKMEETHHTEKIDVPSGTAIKIAEDIIDVVTRKKQWTSNNIKCSNEDINIKSFRVGSVPGMHSVFYESDDDIMEIKHSARSRVGFAKGAVMAAEWVQGKKGCFNMTDFLNF